MHVSFGPSGNGRVLSLAPRRFGKSLFISTLEELFDGSRELFKGLWIDESDYDWSVHPVIRLDLSLYPSSTPDDLKENLKLYLQYVAEKYKITLRPGPYYAQFGDLIRQLSAETQIVILIDEYDNHSSIISRIWKQPSRCGISSKGFIPL